MTIDEFVALEIADMRIVMERFRLKLQDRRFDLDRAEWNNLLYLFIDENNLWTEVRT